MTAAEYDLIVVGSGGGALTGAHLAAKAGLATVVLERTDRLGGTSAYSGGACWLPGSDVQRRAGIPDSTESARTYLGAVLEKPDEARVEAFLEHAPRLVAALEADDGFAFEWLPFPEYFDAPGRVPTAARSSRSRCAGTRCRPRSPRSSGRRWSATVPAGRAATR
jgi:3-oxosteroid 1-dehydrogenase